MPVTTIKALSLIGFLVSWYAFHVKRKLARAKNYKPLCDVSSNISCSKAFTSKYSELLSLPNATLGMFFYFAVYVLVAINKVNAVFYLALLATLGSLVLAYVSYFRQRNFCLVCTATYLANVLLLVFAYLALY